VKSFGKILIGLLQITSELPAMLALSFPDAFTAVLNAMKFFLLDLFEIFRIDCITPLSVHAKFMVTMLFPLVGVGIVWLWRCFVDAWRAHVMHAAQDKLVKFAEAWEVARVKLLEHEKENYGTVAKLLDQLKLHKRELEEKQGKTREGKQRKQGKTNYLEGNKLLLLKLKLERICGLLETPDEKKKMDPDMLETPDEKKKTGPDRLLVRGLVRWEAVREEAADLYLDYKRIPTKSESKATAMGRACSSITHPSIASFYQ
jgi:hypothetical protein